MVTGLIKLGLSWIFFIERNENIDFDGYNINRILNFVIVEFRWNFRNQYVSDQYGFFIELISLESCELIER